MKVLFWNARGLANLDTRLVLKILILKNKPEIVLIAELWVELCNILGSFWSKLNLKVFALYDRRPLASNLLCVCDADSCPTVIASSIQQVTFSILRDSQLHYFTDVYVATSYISRRSLW